MLSKRNSEGDPGVVRVRGKQKKLNKHPAQHQGGLQGETTGSFWWHPRPREGWRGGRKGPAATAAQAKDDFGGASMRGKEEEAGKAAAHPAGDAERPRSRPGTATAPARGPPGAHPRGPGAGTGAGTGPALLTGAGRAPAGGTRS